jgi:hypothetical protein
VTEEKPAPPPPSRREALCLILACAAMLVALAAAELAFRYGGSRRAMARESRHGGLALAYDDLPASPDLVFIGDSRIIHGVDPAVIEAVTAEETGRGWTGFNLGLAGAPPAGDLGWVGHILAKDPPPRAVVLFISEYMFSNLQDRTNATEPIRALYGVADAWSAWRAGMSVEDALTAVSMDLFSTLRFRRRILARVFDGRKIARPEPLGEDGFVRLDQVDFATQHQRAIGRSRAPQLLLGPTARIDEMQFEYLRASIARLQDAGVRVALATAPTASPMWKYFRDDNLYAPIMARVKAIADEAGIPFVDYRATLLVDDQYFSDGDHLDGDGATRLSVQLARKVLIPLLAPSAARPFDRWSQPRPSPGCRLLFDFEELDPTVAGWRTQGDAFQPLAVTGTRDSQARVLGYVGYQLINTCTARRSNQATGEALSPDFVLSQPKLAFLIGGGSSAELGVELIVDGTTVLQTTGEQSEALHRVVWDVTPWRGRTVHLRVIDRDRGDWGHLLVDQVEVCD